MIVDKHNLSRECGIKNNRIWDLENMGNRLINPEGLHVCSFLEGKRYSTPAGVVQALPPIFYKHLMPPVSFRIH